MSLCLPSNKTPASFPALASPSTRPIILKRSVPLIKPCAVFASEVINKPSVNTIAFFIPLFYCFKKLLLFSLLLIYLFSFNQYPRLFTSGFLSLIHNCSIYPNHVNASRQRIAIFNIGLIYDCIWI